MANYEDPAVAGKEAQPSDGYRPIGHITRDLKAVDAEINKLCGKRSDLVREMRALAEAAQSYAENAESNPPSACSMKENTP